MHALLRGRGHTEVCMHLSGQRERIRNTVAVSNPTVFLSLSLYRARNFKHWCSRAVFACLCSGEASHRNGNSTVSPAGSASIILCKKRLMTASVWCCGNCTAAATWSTSSAFVIHTSPLGGGHGTAPGQGREVSWWERLRAPRSCQVYFLISCGTQMSWETSMPYRHPYGYVTLPQSRRIDETLNNPGHMPLACWRRTAIAMKSAPGGCVGRCAHRRHSVPSFFTPCWCQG